MTPRLLSDYIKVYETTLSTDQCQALIDRFEASSAQHEGMKQKDGIFSFVMLNVTHHWPEVHADIWNILKGCLLRSHQSLGLRHFWPDHTSAEPLRLKRYLPNGIDRFDPHVDVLRRADSDRFVTGILYLNEPGGGETVFPDLDLAVQPAPGRLVVFPPLWTFVHAGMPPRDRPKYILHTYLLYPHDEPAPAHVA